MNEQIRAREVRLISETGEQLGVMPMEKAKQLANEKNLDIALITPTAVPVVCKIMDYGKFKFDSQKREKEIKKNQKIVEIKELQLSMTIDVHDMETKAKHAIRFLNEGNKVKLILKIRRREQTYSKNALGIIEKFYAMLNGVGVMDGIPVFLGRNVTAVISPNKIVVKEN
ncbi:MAG: translation initiation factor IF-3 [Clostridia bacterium]